MIHFEELKDYDQNLYDKRNPTNPKAGRFIWVVKRTKMIYTAIGHRLVDDRHEMYRVKVIGGVLRTRPEKKDKPPVKWLPLHLYSGKQAGRYASEDFIQNTLFFDNRTEALIFKAMEIMRWSEYLGEPVADFKFSERLLETKMYSDFRDNYPDRFLDIWDEVVCD